MKNKTAFINSILEVDCIVDTREDIVDKIRYYKYGRLDTLQKLGLISYDDLDEYEHILNCRIKARVEKLNKENGQ